MEITSLTIGLIVGGVIAYVILHLLNKTKNVSKTEFDGLTLKYYEADKNYRLFEDKAKTLQSTNDELSNKIKTKESEITQYQNKATLLEEKLNNSESKISDLSEKLTTEQATNKSQQEDINMHKQKISELTANNNSISENLQKQNAINDKQTKQIEELTTKITDLTSQVSKLTVNNEALNDKLTNQKTEIEELQKTAHLQFEKIANKLFEEKSEKFTTTNKTNIETLLNPLKEDINKFKEKVEATHTEETK